jgi:2-polyprenyl-6-methoxyphenol hydroxylase-like FAD-dependent oxidoreductase
LSRSAGLGNQGATQERGGHAGGDRWRRDRGLTAALSLHAVGVEAIVCEAVAELRPLGVGINLLPHAVRELTELGLGEALAARGVETRALVYANRHGQEIWREPRGRFAGYGWPQYSIHRGVLQMLLAETVRARLGPDAIRLGAAAVGADDGVVALRSGDTIRGDVIVAADGIHSALRAQAYPDEGPPIWNHRVLWRGVTEAEPYLGGAVMVMAGHARQKFVCYPIEEASRRRARINWIAELRYPEDTVGGARTGTGRAGSRISCQRSRPGTSGG